MIEVKNLSRTYGAFKAVDDVSFNIAQGEIVGLLGHNGAGKTTIMKMMTGFIEPSGGSVLIDGLDVQENALAVQARMGYLPESPPIYPELSVIDYLSHAAELRSLDPAGCVPQAIASTQLTEKAFDRIDTLSRGYRQRLGVAQAILHKPRVLVLDEPSNGLDPTQIREMRSLIKALAEHATVLLSTHIMQEVSAICDRVLILRGGELVVDERLADLKEGAGARLRTDGSVDVKQITAAVSGIAQAQSLGGGEWRLEFNGEPDDALAGLATALVSAQVPVYHLAREARDLETLFAEVSEEAQDAA